MNRRYCSVLFAVLTAIVIAFLMQGSAYAEKLCPKCKKHFADKYAFCDKEGSKLSPIKVFASKLKQKSKPRFQPKMRVKTRTRANLVPKMQTIYIPAGSFLMGTSDSEGPVDEGFIGSLDGAGAADERPQHSVYLSAYWIGKYEVTVAQYRKFCQMTRRRMPVAPSWGWIDNHPIVNVSWNDADAFAKWAGGHLPTEAQWEKAARWDETNGHANKYPWGDHWDSLLCNNALGTTSPVGSYPSGASPYGCQDMAGNVQEWCNDWWGRNYSQNPVSDPQGPAIGTFGNSRILRGGSYFDFGSAQCRCAARIINFPNYYSEMTGFRIAR